MQQISIEPLFAQLDWSDTKIHVATIAPNGASPLDAFLRSFDEWMNEWNGKHQSRDYFNRSHIFTIIELPESNKWLFGGVFDVKSNRPAPRMGKPKRRRYSVELNPIGEELIGRVIIHWEKDARPMGRNPEHPNVLSKMFLSEVLRIPYAGEDFPGFTNIDHSYEKLEIIWKEEKADWYRALKNAHGVYLITDTCTGKRYVGSATGEEGVYSRWRAYLSNGHGGNKLLKELIRAKGLGYAQQYYKFSILEISSSRDSVTDTLNREEYWKRVLMTVGPHGYN